MTTIVKNYTFSPNTTASSSEVNANFDTIYNDYNGGITAANLASNAVTTSKITDAAVTTAKIADANVTVGKMATTMGAGSGGAGAWDSWTPTLANFTQGNGTIVAKYIQVGKTVIGQLTFTLGTTSAVGTAGTFSTPVTASSNYTIVNNAVGCAFYADTGTASTIGVVRIETTTTLRPLVQNSAGTYLTTAGMTATVPHTWAATDVLQFSFCYEAA